MIVRRDARKNVRRYAGHNFRKNVKWQNARRDARKNAERMFQYMPQNCQIDISWWERSLGVKYISFLDMPYSSLGTCTLALFRLSSDFTTGASKSKERGFYTAWAFFLPDLLGLCGGFSGLCQALCWASHRTPSPIQEYHILVSERIGTMTRWIALDLAMWINWYFGMFC